MFEQEIRTLTEQTIERIKELGNEFTLDALSSVSIHPAVVRYISSELDYMIFRERQVLLHQSRFDYSDRELFPLFLKIGEVVKAKKVLQVTDVQRLVERAIAMNANYILKPNFTLLKFLFSDAVVRTEEEIKLRLNHIYEYEYIKRVLLTALEMKKKDRYNMSEFKQLIGKMQTELLQSYRSYVIENALDTIHNFFNFYQTEVTAISPVGIEIFLLEKEQYSEIEKLKRYFGGSLPEMAETSLLKDILFGSVPVKEDAVAQIVMKVSSVEEDAGIIKQRSSEIVFDMPKPITSSPSVAPAPPKPEEPVTAFKDVASSDDKLEVESLDAFLNDAGKGADLQFEAVAVEDEQQPASDIFSSAPVVEPEPEETYSAKAGDIFSYFTDSEKNKIIKQVFNEDHMDFVNTVENVASCQTHGEAEELLGMVLGAYSIELTNKLAVMIFERLKTYYRDIGK